MLIYSKHLTYKERGVEMGKDAQKGLPSDPCPGSDMHNFGEIVNAGAVLDEYNLAEANAASDRATAAYRGNPNVADRMAPMRQMA